MFKVEDLKRGRQSWVRNANIPMQRVGVSFSDLTKVTVQARSKLEGWKTAVINGQVIRSQGQLCGKGLILVGGPGSGKSYIGSAILQDILVEASLQTFDPQVNNLVLRPGYFLPFSDLVEMKSAVIRGEGDEELLQQVQGIHSQDSLNVRVLVLDDLGKEHMTGNGWVRTLLAETLRRRYDVGFPTIVSTNVSTPLWSEVYGDSVGSLASGSFFPAISLDAEVTKSGKR